ncbi:MAG: hypothetical protein MRY74_05805 [Neomegalonema sp.]|nr:hypothetical protein [Neomegalonema sp.]
MTLVSAAIPSLVNGISQQTASQRLSSQAEAQTNFLSSLVDGLRKRPTSWHRARLTTADWSAAALHVINRDAAERYVVAISNGDLQVFDLEGAPQTVNFPDGKAYLASAAPDDDIRAVTVADYTFILNRSVTAEMAAATTPTRPKEALVNVRSGNYGRTYEIKIDGAVVAQYSTPDGSSASQSASITTTHIATELYNDLVAAGLTGFTITRYQNVLHIVKATGDFSIAVEDGYAGEAMKVAKDKLQRFTDLPTKGPSGFLVEIVGDATTRFDNYYVAFEKSDDADSDGVWVETVAPGEAYQLAPTTMPHLLVREADGTFTFKPAEWKERVAGDSVTAPPPSFIGRRLNDVFFFRNRFGLLADENVILSQAGGYFNFWPKTATAQLDSDPIDIAGAHNRVSILRHAAPFNRQLLLFADQSQFILGGGDVLTPASATLRVMTEFVASVRAKPASAGRSVFFSVEKGGHSSIREIVLDSIGEATDAQDVAKHVPTLIPQNVRRLAAASNDEMLIALSDEAPNRLFVYRYYWNRDDKLQSSWSVWEMAAEDRILAAEFVDARLVLVVARPDGVYLEDLDLDLGAFEAAPAGRAVDWALYMDRRISEADCALTYDAGTGETLITLPYEENNPLWVIARPDDAAGASPAGRAFEHTRPSASTIAVQGDVTAAKLAIGRKVLSRYVFSEMQVRQGEAPPIGEGRLQLLYFTVFYAESGPFRVIVQPLAREPYRYDLSGRLAGAEANQLGRVALESGKFRAPIYAQNGEVEISVETDGYLPVQISSAEWEGRFVLRSQRR